MMEIGRIDFVGCIIVSVLVGIFIKSLIDKWNVHQSYVANKMTKPNKELTPELIQSRIVKAQWKLLNNRMGNLTRNRNKVGPGISSALANSSAIKFERKCLGVLSLAHRDRSRYDEDQTHVQPMPLCDENRERLINLGFKKFSDDGLWVFYVEPNQLKEDATLDEFAVKRMSAGDY